MLFTKKRYKMLTFTQFLNEGRGFELGGKKYSSGFGRYTCDGKSISKEEYMKASTQYKGGNVSSKSSENTNIVSYKNGSVKVSNHNIDFNIAYGNTITRVTGKALTFSNLPGYKFAIDKRISRNDNDLYAITELHTGLSVGYVNAKKNESIDNVIKSFVSNEEQSFVRKCLNNKNGKEEIEALIAIHKLDFPEGTFKSPNTTIKKSKNNTLEPTFKQDEPSSNTQTNKSTTTKSNYNSKEHYELIKDILTSTDMSNRNAVDKARYNFKQYSQDDINNSSSKVKVAYNKYKKDLKELKQIENQFYDIISMTDNNYSDKEISNKIGDGNFDSMYKRFFKLLGNCTDNYSIIKNNI